MHDPNLGQPAEFAPVHRVCDQLRATSPCQYCKTEINHQTTIRHLPQAPAALQSTEART